MPERANVFNYSIKTMSTQYITLTTWYVKIGTFQKHLNYIPRANLLHTKNYSHSKNKESKLKLIKRSLHASSVTMN